LSKVNQFIMLKKWTKPFLAMPEIYQKENPIESYRLYYLLDKKNFLYYTKRSKPDWIVKGE